MHQIATEPNVPLSTLFAPDLDTPRAEGKTPAATLSISVSYDSSICVQKATETPTIHLDNGIRWDRISPRESDGLAFLHLVFDPRAGYSEYLRHNGRGREIVYVVEGTLSFHVGFAGHAQAMFGLSGKGRVDVGWSWSRARRRSAPQTCTRRWTTRRMKA